MPMSDTTATPRYFAIQSTSAIDGGKLNLGFGLTSKAAWEDAVGPDGKRPADWWLAEVDQLYYYSQGEEGWPHVVRFS